MRLPKIVGGGATPTVSCTSSMLSPSAGLGAAAQKERPREDGRPRARKPEFRRNFKPKRNGIGEARSAQCHTCYPGVAHPGVASLSVGGAFS